LLSYAYQVIIYADSVLQNLMPMIMNHRAFHAIHHAKKEMWS